MTIIQTRRLCTGLIAPFLGVFSGFSAFENRIKHRSLLQLKPFWPNCNISPSPRFGMGPLLNHHLGAEVVWGRYNLPRSRKFFFQQLLNHRLQNNFSNWSTNQKTTSPCVCVCAFSMWHIEFDLPVTLLRLQQGGFLRRAQQFHLLWPQPCGVRRSRSNLRGGWWWIKDEGWSGIRETILRLFAVNPSESDGLSSGILIQQKQWSFRWFCCMSFWCLFCC